MGSPDFALPTLQALHEQYEFAGVITQPDRPAGRGQKLQPSAVKVRELCHRQKMRRRVGRGTGYFWWPDKIAADHVTFLGD